MSADVHTQLAAYGRWIERTHDVALRPVPPPRVVRPEGDETELIEVDAVEPPLRRRQFAFAAAIVLMIAGVVGAAVTIRSDPAPRASSVPTDPPGPLYLLPADDGVALASGSAAMLTTEPWGRPGYTATLGRSANGGFEDLVTVTTFTEFDTDEGWVEGEHGGLPTWFFDRDFMTMVAQDRDDWWVVVQSGPDRSTAVYDTLDDVNVTPTGDITLDPSSTRQIVDIEPLDASQQDALVARWTATLPDASTPNVAVETYTFPGGIALGGARIDRIEPTTINGVSAWRTFSTVEPAVSNSGEVELRSAVQWNFSPHRLVVVGGPADIETIEAFAASLQQVTADEWGNAIPGFTTECTLQQPHRCNELPTDSDK